MQTIGAQQIDHRATLRLMASGAQIADVLPAHEYRSAHIKGAIHTALPRLFADARVSLAIDRPVVVYCRDAL
jgi:rhodanese-related sulfurtransferase